MTDPIEEAEEIAEEAFEKPAYDGPTPAWMDEDRPSWWGNSPMEDDDKDD